MTAQAHDGRRLRRSPRSSRGEGRRGKSRGAAGWALAAMISAILALGVVSFRGMASSAPALSPELRITGPNGDWRPTSRSALYDHAAYASERAEAMIAGSGDMSPPEAPLLAALQLAIESVEAAPADAYAWTLLAAMAGGNGLSDAAEWALARSRTLAPYNAGLSIERLRLLPLHQPPFNDALQEAILRDFQVAADRRAAELARLIGGRDELDALLAAAAAEPGERAAPDEAGAR